MKKNWFILIVSLSFIVGCLCACSVQEAKEENVSTFVGTWASDRGVIELREDGTGTIDSDGQNADIKWKIEDSILSMIIEGQLIKCVYELENDTLILGIVDSEKSDENKELERFDASPEGMGSTIIGEWKYDNSVFEFKEDGTGSIHNGDLAKTDIKWIIKDNSLKILRDDRLAECIFEIQDENYLILTEIKQYFIREKLVFERF